MVREETSDEASALEIPRIASMINTDRCRRFASLPLTSPSSEDPGLPDCRHRGTRRPDREQARSPGTHRSVPRRPWRRCCGWGGSADRAHHRVGRHGEHRPARKLWLGPLAGDFRRTSRFGPWSIQPPLRLHLRPISDGKQISFRTCPGLEPRRHSIQPEVPAVDRKTVETMELIRIETHPNMGDGYCCCSEKVDTMLANILSPS